MMHNLSRMTFYAPPLPGRFAGGLPGEPTTPPPEPDMFQQAESHQWSPYEPISLHELSAQAAARMAGLQQSLPDLAAKVSPPSADELAGKALRQAKTILKSRQSLGEKLVLRRVDPKQQRLLAEVILYAMAQAGPFDLAALSQGEQDQLTARYGKYREEESRYLFYKFFLSRYPARAKEMEEDRQVLCRLAASAQRDNDEYDRKIRDEGYGSWALYERDEADRANAFLVHVEGKLRRITAAIARGESLREQFTQRMPEAEARVGQLQSTLNQTITRFALEQSRKRLDAMEQQVNEAMDTPEVRQILDKAEDQKYRLLAQWEQNQQDRQTEIALANERKTQA